MGGIAGLFDMRGEREPDRAALLRMTGALAHRGPDSQGVHVEPGLALGHRRRFLGGAAGGKQPFESQGGRTILTLDGAVYNRPELEREVVRAGRSPRGRSDAEVLAELLDLRGTDALPSVDGAFALGAWNPRERSLLLARDRFGEKPLYYAATRDGWLAFASEMRGITASGLVEPLLSEEAVADYLFYGYVPDPDTIYRGVQRVPAGHTLTVRRDGKALQPRQWYTLRQRATRGMALEDAGREAVRLLDEAVARRDGADVPSGALLSGDMEAGAIVASMARGERRPITITMGSRDPRRDDREAARDLALLLGTDHRDGVAEADLLGLLPHLARTFGEPFADGSALMTYLLGEQASRHVSIGLCGTGADEVFCGHERYAAFASGTRLRATVRGAAIGLAGHAARWSHRPRLGGQSHPARRALGPEPATAYAGRLATVPANARAEVLAPPLREVRPERHVEAAWSAADTDEPLLAAQAADIATRLPGRTLFRLDRASMAHGLERRLPFLDPRLAEFGASLPRPARAARGEPKRALRHGLGERLPEEALWRASRGREASTDAWFRAGAGSLTDALLNRKAWRDCGLFDVGGVERLARRHVQEKGRHGQALWSVLMFDAFLDLA